MLALILGEEVDNVHVHYVEASMARLHQLQQIEVDRRSPLDAEDPEFQKLDIKWITNPGNHYFIDSDSGQVVAAVKIL